MGGEKQEYKKHNLQSSSYAADNRQEGTDTQSDVETLCKQPDTIAVFHESNSVFLLQFQLPKQCEKQKWLQLFLGQLYF